MEATLLVELLTEELPPKSLRMLGEAFADLLVSEIVKYRLKDRDPQGRMFATPRRLAIQIPMVRDRAPDSSHSVEGPVRSNAKAVEGFARKHKVSPESLEQRQTDKGEIVVANFTSPGVRLDAVLASVVEGVLGKLPVPKMMRWGAGEARFVRPVHGLVMMHGSRIVPGTVLGLEAGNRTRGHRFLGAAEIVLAQADDYERRLADDGRVIADFAARRAEIDSQLQAQAQHLGASLGRYEDLLDEVTALVELPTVYAGEFDRAFLEVPQECLILTMRQNQKYFPLFGADGRLLAKFLMVSNMRIPDPRHIVTGNERVVRPRLEDARFFFDQDRKARLETRVPQLANVVHHNKLGSQLERVERLQLGAGAIARSLGADAVLAERAAWLAKADLITGMVGEFPELQGTMGRYYALHDGEPETVADAIEAHYRPRFAGDELPRGAVACALALADKLDTLIGMFAAGGAPTGDKDPFALRRHALGVLRILTERKLPLPLPGLLAEAAARFRPGTVGANVCGEVFGFMLERLRHHARELGYAADEIDAVVSQAPERVDLVPARLEAVKSFRRLPQAESLAAANKRIRNLLKKSEEQGSVVDAARLAHPAEKDLHQALERLAPQVESSIAMQDYAAALNALAGVRAAVDRFFDEVMVNVDDSRVRANRIALLRRLDALMNRVADISRLAA